MKIKVKPISAHDRFWAWVEKGRDRREPDETYRGACWLWTRTFDEDGYGVFWDGAKQVTAHVFAFTEAEGRPPAKGMEVDHLCRNRPCVRRSHFEEVTHEVNTLRSEGVTAQNARKAGCGKPGHGDYPAGTRSCPQCKKDRVKRYNDKKRGKV